MNRLSRFLTSVLFVAAIAVIGFTAGLYIGGTCCVPDNSGLAGGAIVVGYGVLGGGIALLLAILLARALTSQQLVAATLVLGVIGGVLAGVILKVYLDSRAETEAHMQQAYAGMLKFRVALVPKADGPPQPFRSIAFDWGQKQFKVRLDDRRCAVELQPEDAAAMLGALRDVEGIVFKDPAPCAGTSGSVHHILDMYIPEASGEISKAKIGVTGACLQKYPALGKPMELAGDIVARSDIPEKCP